MNQHLKAFELPLGSRFRYLGDSSGPVWVLLDRAGCGLIASEPKLSDPLWRQSLCSVSESPELFRELVVEHVPVKEY